ncbi:transposase [Candidatus Woesebacteria bacterium]|nr:MAG: transposase [Candidatus Woesebacteria bacterium]
MPRRNVVKVYADHSYYHVYNRGVEKRSIFLDPSDYKKFTCLLVEALTPPYHQHIDGFDVPKRLPQNFEKEIDLISYCLMPNHFHLLIRQELRNSMEKFMHSITTRYSMYFNKKYSRVGTLFQSNYRASLVENDIYLLHLTKYIHLNPRGIVTDISNWHSSCSDYLGMSKRSWIKPEIVLSIFSKSKLTEIKSNNTYQNFMNDLEPPALSKELSID